MSDKRTKIKLKRLLSFYEKELKVIKADFAMQNAVVLKLESEIARLIQQFETAPQQLSLQPATIANRQMGIQWLMNLKQQIAQRQTAIVPEQELRETKRIALMDQMAKIESMEKLIQRKSESINYAAQRSDQNERDEQYLMTQFGEAGP